MASVPMLAHDPRILFIVLTIFKYSSQKYNGLIFIASILLPATLFTGIILVVVSLTIAIQF